MRTFFLSISVAATGYLAFVANDELRQPSKEIASPALTPTVAVTSPAIPQAVPAEAEPIAPESEPSEPTASAKVAVVPTPAPEVPKVRTAPPGTYYLTKRVSIETNAGIIAILPGETVKQLYRNKDGTVRVKWGAHEVTVPEANLTKEFDVAANQPIAVPANRLFGKRSEIQPTGTRE